MVIIPIMIDQYALDGMDILLEQIESTFKKILVAELSTRCGATKFYYKFVKEFL